MILSFKCDRSQQIDMITYRRQILLSILPLKILQNDRKISQTVICLAWLLFDS